jgi:hypothetical protein
MRHPPHDPQRIIDRDATAVNYRALRLSFSPMPLTAPSIQKVPDLMMCGLRRFGCPCLNLLLSP